MANDRLNPLKGQGGREAITIIASVKVRDEIVLATDSISQLTIRNASEQGKPTIKKASSTTKPELSQGSPHRRGERPIKLLGMKKIKNPQHPDFPWQSPLRIYYL